MNEYGRTEMPSSYDQWRTAAPDDHDDEGEGCQWCDYTGNCQTCYGTGELEHNPCEKCNGTGLCSSCHDVEPNFGHCPLCFGVEVCLKCNGDWCNACYDTGKCPECSVTRDEVLAFVANWLEVDDYLFIGDCVANGRDWRAHFENNPEDDAT